LVPTIVTEVPPYSLPAAGSSDVMVGSAVNLYTRLEVVLSTPEFADTSNATLPVLPARGETGEVQVRELEERTTACVRTPLKEHDMDEGIKFLP
jgi:hypothetical protein